MKRYSREEMIESTGARAEELAQFEAQRLLVPNYPWRLFKAGEPYYTEDQLNVLRWLINGRRAAEASRRSTR